MERAGAQNYIAIVCDICDPCSKIAEHVNLVEKKLSELSATDAPASGAVGSACTLDYAPAIDCIKSLYQEYVRAFTCAKEFFRAFVQRLMSNMTKALVNKIPSPSDAMRAAVKVADGCEVIEASARKTSSALTRIYESMTGIGMDGVQLPTPTQIQAFISANAGALGQYDPSTGIPDAFDKLKDCLLELNGVFDDLLSSASSLQKVKEEYNFSRKETEAEIKADIEALCQEYNTATDNLDFFANTKGGQYNQILVFLQKADSLMKAVQAKIAAEIQKRVAPISEAFDRIVPTVPVRPSENVFSVKLKGKSLVSSRMSVKELLQKLQNEAVATITLSTACAVQEDGKDCNGQFSLAVLKQKHVVSSDAKVLFVVDDGYSAIRLPEWEVIDANDFNADDELYFSQSALEKLQTISKVEIKAE